jgi:HAD superfamily hydrolase (TIGR01509 family)
MRDAPRGAAARGSAALEAAIFDLDGTLVDSEPLYAASDAAFLAGLGIGPDSLAEGEFVGLGTLAFLSIVAERFPDSPLAALPPAERARLKDEAYLKFSAGRLRPFPSVLALVARLAERGLALALASGSSPSVIAAELEAVGLDRTFAVTLSSSEVARGKPEPDIFLEAARRLGVPPSRCLVVEDSRYGVAAAKKAGMRCLALPSVAARLQSEFALADLVSPGGAADFDLAGMLAGLERIGLPRPGA